MNKALKEAREGRIYHVKKKSGKDLMEKVTFNMGFKK